MNHAGRSVLPSFSRWQQLALHLGACGCDDYQNVYCVSLLIMQKLRQPLTQKKRARQRWSWVPGKGPALLPIHPRPCAGGLSVRTRAVPTPVPGGGPPLLLLSRPLQTSTELSPRLGISLALLIKALEPPTQEAFQKIPPPAPATALHPHLCV